MAARTALYSALISGALFCLPVSGDDYYRRTFFDNSITADVYYYSSGKALEPSLLELRSLHLPVETNTYLTPPNALRLHWTSRPNGGWSAEIDLYRWRNRNLFFPGNTLRFWCRSEQVIRAADLPRIVIQDGAYGFSAPLSLAPYMHDLQANKWVEVHLPLRAFRQVSVLPLDAHRTAAIRFVQGATDAQEHTLFVDEIRIDDTTRTAVLPLAPTHLTAKAYERHVDLTWHDAGGAAPERYVIYRSTAGGEFKPIGIQRPGVSRFADYLGKPGQTVTYKIKAQNAVYGDSPFSALVTATTNSMSDDELLTMVEEASFRFYWEGAHPVSGMTRENLPGNDEITAVGATGFGIMALVVGAERGFITHEQAVQRLMKLTRFLDHADRYHGAWPHFLNGATGRRMPVFDSFDNGADLVETSFLLEGLLTARQYFKSETELYNRISKLWNEVDWSWFRRTPDGKTLYWHWSPEYSWYINHPLYGWNEVMITYLLAIASTTHPVPPSLYYTGWAGDPPEFLNGHTYFGIKLDLGVGTGGPLFFTHYSFLGFDPHGMHDQFTDYIEQNRNMARINYAYCQGNPSRFPGAWGITAVDGPRGYVPYEPSPNSDDGTIAPTGAVASMPYTPAESLAALQYFYREQGDKLWDIYGFRDAFNLQENWYSGINMGLNQAPMAIMIENYRTGLIWKAFGANPEIRAMIGAIGLK